VHGGIQKSITTDYADKTDLNANGKYKTAFLLQIRQMNID
jgi:hypothetical protein